MKLSKGQADWLIEQFQIKWLGNDALKSEVQDSLALTTLKLLINQCTEKEFPEFHGKINGRNDDIMITLNSINEVQVWSNSHGNGDSAWQFTLLNGQLKALAAGLNEIVEWLNERIR